MGVLPRTAVASGSFVVGGREPRVLDAFLGTCVGVAICDPEARVGGLIHLLLPEPTGIERHWQPENYATTGLPIFIHALMDEGAKLGDMEAHIAGGALVGPVSETDLNLDVGGRTADAVEEILACTGIRVKQFETGGLFTCKLSLNLGTFETKIEPVVDRTNGVKRDFARPDAGQLEKVICSVSAIPQVALKIIRMFNNHTTSLGEVAREIRRDQIISARVLSLCNSALFGLKKKIESLDRAAVLLGERMLLQLILSASMETLFSHNGEGYSLCKGGLYRHALGTALVSEKLARFTGRVPPDLAYTAGLTHDIGKVVLDQYISPANPLFYRRTHLEGLNHLEAEDEILGIRHTDAGFRLAECWSLPESLMEVAGCHHSPEKASVHPELTHLVYLADLLMSRFVVGQVLESLDTDALSQRLEKLGLSTSQLPVLVDLIPDPVFHS